MVIMNKVGEKIHATKVSSDSKIAKISIVGAGMRSHSGVAAQIFKTVAVGVGADQPRCNFSTIYRRTRDA